MKIYFSASNDVDLKTIQFFKKIIDFLEKGGYRVKHCLLLDGNKIELKSDNDFSTIHNNVLKQINDAEIFIADISFPSGGVGYQISHAIYQRKPIVVIYSKLNKSNPSVIIKGIKSCNVIILSYKDTSDLFDRLSLVLEKATRMVKVRFNLVMSNDYYSFIENVSKKLKISKTEYILRLIKERKSEE